MVVMEEDEEKGEKKVNEEEKRKVDTERGVEKKKA